MPFIRFLAICIVFKLLLPITCPARHLSFRHLDASDGMPSSIVYCVHQDAKGYIWLGTNAGLCRFDGKNFRILTASDGLPDNEILGLYEDRQQRIWLRTYNGRPGFLRNDSVFNMDNTEYLRTFVPNTFISHIWESEAGDIYLNSGTLYRLPADGSTESWGMERFFEEASAMRFEEGNKVVVVHQNSVTELSPDGKMRTLPPPPLIFIRLKHKTINRKNGSTLLSWGPDLYVWDGMNFALQPTKFPSRIISLYEDEEENTWVGTLDGAYRLDRQLQKRDSFLMGTPVSGVLVDAEGNLWLSTIGSGLYFTANPSAITLGEEDGITGLYCLEIDPAGNLCAGGSEGQIFRISEGKITESLVNRDRKAEKKKVQHLVWTSRGEIMGGGDGETFFGREGEATELNMLALKDLKQEAEGRTWAAYPYGLWELTEGFLKEMANFGSEKQHGVVNGKVPGYRPVFDGRCTSIELDRSGTLYLGTIEGVYTGRRNGAGKWDFQRETALPSGGITDLALDPSGNLWGSELGAGIFCQQKDQILHFGAEMGLPKNSVTRLHVVSEEEVWGATNSGLLYLGKENGQWRCRIFGETEGLASPEVRDVLVRRDTIWVATSRGLSRIPRLDLLSEEKPPRLHLSAVQVMGQSVDPTASLRLKHHENRLQVQFDALDFNTRGQVQYRYRLQGLDTAWSQTYANEVSYNSIPPGEYTFEVACRRASGFWSGTRSFSFRIERPWWQETWFWLLAGSLYLALVWLLFRARYRRMRRKAALEQRVLQSEQKALRAQMNPHFIFNALNSVQHFFLNQRPREGNSYLSKFSSLIRKILENSDQMYLSIEEELQMIRPYIDFEQLRSGDKFDFELEILPGLDPYNTLIPGMLIQPLLENAIWHGIRHREGRGLIRLEFAETENGLSIRVVDNGVGRAEAARMESEDRKEHRSMGLKLIRERIEVVNALGNDRLSMHIADLKGPDGAASGTLVQINIENRSNG